MTFDLTCETLSNLARGGKSIHIIYTSKITDICVKVKELIQQLYSVKSEDVQAVLKV